MTSKGWEEWNEQCCFRFKTRQHLGSTRKQKKRKKKNFRPWSNIHNFWLLVDCYSPWVMSAISTATWMVELPFRILLTQSLYSKWGGDVAVAAYIYIHNTAVASNSSLDIVPGRVKFSNICLAVCSTDCVKSSMLNPGDRNYHETKLFSKSSHFFLPQRVLQQTTCVWIGISDKNKLYIVEILVRIYG